MASSPMAASWSRDKCLHDLQDRPSQQIKEKHHLAMQQAITWRVDDHTPCVNQVMTIDLAPRLKLGAVLPPEA